MKENRIGFIVSLAVHGGLVVIAALGGLVTGWGGRKKLVLDEIAPCTVPLDVVAVSDVSQAPISKPKNLEPAHAKEASRDEDPVPDLKEEPPKKEKIPEKAPEKIPEVPALPKEEDMGNTLDKLLAKDEPKKKPDKKKEKDKPRKAARRGKRNRSRDDEDFQSLLRDVDRDRPDFQEAETPITDPNSTSRYGAARIGPLAMSSMDRVRRLLMSRWRIPPGAMGRGQLVVVIALELGPDARVRKATILHDEGTPRHPAYAAASDSALVAVHDPEPLPLPLDQYDTWRDLTIRFSPE